MDKMRRWAKEQRGSILLFTTILVIPLMIIIGGLAMDLAYYGTGHGLTPRTYTTSEREARGRAAYSALYPYVRANVDKAKPDFSSTRRHTIAEGITRQILNAFAFGQYKRFEAITPGTLQTLAETYLKPDTVLRARAKPETQ